MNVFSYKIDHDYGLAPNPFGGYCTLAVCKSSIRRNRNLQIGDWVIGTGSKVLKNLHHLIYAMKVEEKITFDEYWNDPRFQHKKPDINGSLVKMFGDNIYHRDPVSDDWIQENSAHSEENGTCNVNHCKRDVGGKNVLISNHFYYFGDQAFLLPEEFRGICNDGRDMKYLSIPDNLRFAFVEWLESCYETGIHGDPINWKEYLNQNPQDLIKRSPITGT